MVTPINYQKDILHIRIGLSLGVATTTLVAAIGLYVIITATSQLERSIASTTGEICAGVALLGTAILLGIRISSSYPRLSYLAARVAEIAAPQ